MSDVNEVLEALNVLNNTTDHNVRQQANAWLTKWKSSSQAWMHADGILN